MHVTYSSKMFFKNYHTRAVLRTVASRVYRYGTSRKPMELIELASWCMEKLGDGNYVIKNRYEGRDSDMRAVYHQRIYLNSEDYLNQLIAAFQDRVVEVTKPYNQQHQMSLEVRNLTEIRSHLLYNKYRHVIYFKYDRSGQVYKWLQDYFKDDGNQRVREPYWPRVYLTDQDHMTMIRLTWAENIDYIKNIQLLDSVSTV